MPGGFPYGAPPQQVHPLKLIMYVLV
jgi:hypothetical protein